MNSIAAWKNIKKHSLLIILGIATLFLAINYFANSTHITNDGVFVLGKIIGKKEYKAGSSAYEYEYFFRNTRYIGKTVGVGLGSIGELIFVSLLPDDPGNHKIIEFSKVPYCLSIDSVPPNGWSHLPTCLPQRK